MLSPPPAPPPLKVILRVRPTRDTGASAAAVGAGVAGSSRFVAAPGALSSSSGASSCLRTIGACNVAIVPPEGSQAHKSGDHGGTYAFTRVWGPSTTQANFFEGTAAPLVRAMIAGEGAENVIMSYGVTSSGKTYTMEGTPSHPGLIPRACATLFEALRDASQGDTGDAAARAAAETTVHVSHYEVHNEQIFDLLDAAGANPIGGRKCLQLKEDAAGRPVIAGLTELRVGSAQAAVETLRRGHSNRSRAETALNARSSRSHSVFTVTVQRPALFQGLHPGGDKQSVVTCKTHFVDLAGSERGKRAGNVGKRLKEATAINSSLMCLGRCLETLRWNQRAAQRGDAGNAQRRILQRRVPYRESKLTHLFKSALHGWGRVMLIVNVSAAEADYDETAHVLKSAATAAQVSTAPRLELVHPPPPVKVDEGTSPRRFTSGDGAARRRPGREGGFTAQKRRRIAEPAGAAPGSALPANITARGGRSARERERSDVGILLDEWPEEFGDKEARERAAIGMDDQAFGRGGSRVASAEGVRSGGHDDDDNGEERVEDEDTRLNDEEKWVKEREALLGEIEAMRARTVELEAAIAAVETEVREEVSAETAELLREMESAFQAKLEAHKAAAAAAVAQVEGAVVEGGRRAALGCRSGGSTSRRGSGSIPELGKTAGADASRVLELEELLAAATAARDVAEAARDRQAASAQKAREEATALSRQLSDLRIEAEGEAAGLRRAAAAAESAAREAEAVAAEALRDKDIAVAAERAATAAAADAVKVAPPNETSRRVGEAAQEAAREARPPSGDPYSVEPKRWDRGEDGEHSRGERFASKPSDEDKENATRIGASEKNPPREVAQFLSRPPLRRATAVVRGEPGKTPVARRTRAGRARGGA